MKNWKWHRRMQDGLTRLELLAVLGVLALLATIALPALAGGKPRSHVAVCAGNLRQLGVATLSYSMENGGAFPPRSATNFWPQRLLPYYGKLDVLRCPSDTPPAYPPANLSPAEKAPRSYLINGWEDYAIATLSPAEWQLYVNHVGPPMPEAGVIYPSQTILFGEKITGSFHFNMDFFQGIGNDFTEVEYARHGARRGAFRGGGSNHAMVDGSVRMLLYGQALAPLNLWGVTDLWRTNSISLAP